MSHYEFNKKIAMAWINKDKYWLKTEKKRTGDNTQQLCKSKASVSMANSITRRTVHMPLVVSSNITYIKRSRVLDKSLAPDVLLRKRLTQGKYWPIKILKKEAQLQLHYWSI